MIKSFIATILLLITTNAYADIILIQSPIGDDVSIGTATVISDRLAITNKHVVGDKIVMAWVRKKGHRAIKVLAKDPNNDIALLEGDFKGVKHTKFKEASEGSGVALGYLDGVKHKTYPGDYFVDSGFLYFKGSIYPGQSGGIIKDEKDGKAVGVIMGVARDKNTCMDNGSVAVPSHIIKAFIERSLKESSGSKYLPKAIKPVFISE